MTTLARTTMGGRLHHIVAPCGTATLCGKATKPTMTTWDASYVVAAAPMCEPCRLAARAARA